MYFTEKRKGEMFSILNAFISAVTPIVFILAARTVSPIYSAAFGVLMAAILFGILCAFRGTFQELKNPIVWKPLLLGTLFISVFCHTFIYIGYTHTTAGNGSIISLIEILFSFLFFGLILRKEKYTAHALFGAGLMVVGIIIVLAKEYLYFHLGDFLIIVGMLFAPPGNFFQQKARSMLSSETLLFVRSVLGGCVMLILALITSPFPSLQEIQQGWIPLVINGLIILGFAKILWIEAIHRIPVAKALTLSTLAPAGTLLLSFFMLGEIPNWWQLAGLPFVLIGSYLILNKDFLHPVSLKFTGSDS